MSMVAIAFGGGIVDEGVGAAERMIICYIYQASAHTHLPRQPSGRVSGLAIDL